MLFSMYDTKAENFGALFESRTTDEAVRVILSTLLSNQQSNFTKFTEDYQLYKLGDFDCSTGRIESSSPELVKTGLEFKQMFKHYVESQMEDMKGDYNDCREQTSDIVQSA